MIVVSTHNGKTYLQRLLKSLKNVGSTMDVSIVDSASTDQESLDFLKSLEEKNPYPFKIQVYYSDVQCWESGLPKFAAENIPAKKYYFIHDSLEIKHKMFFEELDRRLKPGCVVFLISFPGNFYDSHAQIKFVRSITNDLYFEKGCFGSMFFIHSEDLHKLPLHKIPQIKSKFETCAMERVWGVLFHKSGLNIRTLEGDYNFNRLEEDDYLLFKKSFGGRG